MAITIQTQTDTAPPAQGGRESPIQGRLAEGEARQSEDFVQSWAPLVHSGDETVLALSPLPVAEEAATAHAEAQPTGSEGSADETPLACWSHYAMLATTQPLTQSLQLAAPATTEASARQRTAEAAGFSGAGLTVPLLAARLAALGQAGTLPSEVSQYKPLTTQPMDTKGAELKLSEAQGAVTQKSVPLALLAQLQMVDPTLLDRKAAKPVLSEISALAAAPQEALRSDAPLPQTAKGLEWAPLKLATPQSQWGEQMLSTLKERVEMQVSQNIKQAHIRLDPPDLGRLELTVRMDGDRLSVQLNAANPALRDALIQSSERLRMSLTPQHAGGVDVNVGQGDSRQQGEAPEEEWRILAGRRELLVEETTQAGPRLDRLNALV